MYVENSSGAALAGCRASTNLREQFLLGFGQRKRQWVAATAREARSR